MSSPNEGKGREDSPKEVSDDAMDGKEKEGNATGHRDQTKASDPEVVSDEENTNKDMAKEGEDGSKQTEEADRRKNHVQMDGKKKEQPQQQPQNLQEQQQQQQHEQQQQQQEQQNQQLNEQQHQHQSLRSVRSQPSMMAAVMPISRLSHTSLRELGTTAGATGGSLARSRSRSGSRASSHSTVKGNSKASAESVAASAGGGSRRQQGAASSSEAARRSPQDHQDQDQEEEEISAALMAEDEGGHDTITSLAGEKMLSKYYRRGVGSSGRPPAAGSSGGKLEDLFSRGNEYSSLEDIRESSDDESEEKHSLLRPAAAEPDKEEEEEDFDKDEDEDDLDPDAFVPPDGGYGWMVAAGAFLALFWSAGLVKSYGVIFDEILAAFRGASKSLASWIPAAMVSTALAVAPVTSALCQRLDCRRVTLAGSVLCFCGMALSSLAPTLPLLFCSMGLLTGVGLGLSTTPGVILTARYFTSNRAKANAFCLSGTAAGSFALPFLIEALMSSYGFRGAVLVLSACMGHIAVSAALYRPLRVHAAIANKERRRRIRMEREEDRKSLQSSPQKMALLKADEDAVSVSSSKTGSLVLHHHGQQHRFGSQRSSDGVGGIADPLLLRTRLDLLIDRGSESPISGVSSSWNGDGEGSSSRFHHQLLHHQHHQHRHQPQHIHRHLQHQCSSPARFGGSHRSSTGGGDRKSPGVGGGGVWHVGQHHPHAASSSGGFSPPHSSCPFHGSSNLSLASQENLINCLEGGGGDNSPLPHLNELRYHYPEQQHRQHNVASDSHLAFAPTFGSRVQPAKALSMRDITLHQLSARFSLYKAYLVGNDEAKEKAGNNSGKSSRCGSEVNGSTAAGRTSSKKGSKSRHTSRCSNRSFGRKSSAGNSAAGSTVNLSKQQEQEHRTGGTVRQAGFRRQFSRRSSRASSSLMFSLEDLATDSTSILKDARAASSLKASSRRRKRQHQQHPPPPNSRVDVHHPAISANNSSSNLRSYDRQVSLDRDHVSRARAARKARRTRYYSEGNGAHATEISPPPFRELPQSPPSSSQVSQQAAPPPSRFTVRSSSDDLDKEEGEHKREKSPTNEVTIKDEKGRSCCSSAKSVFLKYIDLSLCREPVFLLLTASVMCMSLGVPHFLIFLPSFARQLEEGREADPALLLSVSSALDLLGRVGAGLALDAGIVPGHLLYSAAMIAAGVSAAAMPLLSAAAVSPAPLPGMMAASAAYGLGSGVWFLMVPLLLAEHLGVERIASSYGLIRFFQSGANLIGPILGGYLWESTGDLRMTFLLMGSMMAGGAVFPLLLPLAIRRRGKDSSKEDRGEDSDLSCEEGKEKDHIKTEEKAS